MYVLRAHDSTERNAYVLFLRTGEQSDNAPAKKSSCDRKSNAVRLTPAFALSALPLRTTMSFTRLRFVPALVLLGSLAVAATTAAADNAIARAKDLYVSAAYEEAL